MYNQTPDFYWLNEEDLSMSDHADYLTLIIASLEQTGINNITVDEIVSVTLNEQTPELINIQIDQKFNETQLFPNLNEQNNTISQNGSSILSINTDDLDVSYTTQIKLTMVESGAGYDNTLGVYTVSSDGTIQTATLAFSNVKHGLVASDIEQIDKKIEGFTKNIEKWQEDPNKNADKIEHFQDKINDLLLEKQALIEQSQYTYTIEGGNGSSLGTFVIADGYNLNNSYENLDLENGSLEFIYHYGEDDERAAKITDNADAIDLVYKKNGQETLLQGAIYHSTERGASTNINPDDQEHTISGLAHQNDSETLRIGFEDLPNLGDSDFNDVIFDIRIEGTIITLPIITLPEDITLNGTYESDILQLDNAGNDTIYGYDGNDQLYGYDGNDSLYGGMGDDILVGGTGNDLLNGHAGLDTADYSTSTSAINVNLLNFTASDGLGTIDTLYSIERIIGTSFNDLIIGSGYDDVLLGGDGSDNIEGRAGNDMIYGENGDDILDGNSGNDTVYGGDGNDTILGSSGEDTLYGGEGNDQIDGGDGNDSLYGEDGEDTLYGGEGNDLIDGGDGNDALIGWTGDDTFIGSAGTDSINGWLGVDTVDYSSWNFAVTVNLTSGTTDKNGDGITDDTLIQIENVTGTAFDDYLIGFNLTNNILIGGAGNDKIESRSGDDTLRGGTGNDSLMGQGGNDLLYGDEGDDFLRGGDGNDFLAGGSGRDHLFGGSGADTFTFLSTDNFDSYDSIRDFSLADGDSVDISDLLEGYDSTTSLIEDFVRFSNTNDGLNTAIFVNTDGQGTDFRLVGIIEGSTGLTDEAQLISNGTLIA
jgi:Ca2+-binding RTX toxin-like protein